MEHHDLTVEEVLAQIGWPLGRRGRTRCPIHPNATNDSEFSYRDHGWYCFSCGEKGGAWALLRRFRPPLKGVRLPPGQWRHWLQPPGPPRPSRRMSDAVKATKRAVEDELGVEHQAAHAVLRRGQRLLAATSRIPGCPNLVAPDWRWELGGALVIEGWARLDAVDPLLKCDCRGERGLSNLFHCLGSTCYTGARNDSTTAAPSVPLL